MTKEDNFITFDGHDFYAPLNISKGLFKSYYVYMRKYEGLGEWSKPIKSIMYFNGVDGSLRLKVNGDFFAFPIIKKSKGMALLDSSTINELYDKYQYILCNLNDEY
jgi:hypothetical protein